MIRYIRYVLLAALAVLLVTVALANRELVLVKLLPTDLAAVSGYGWQREVPLFVVMFGGIIIGLLIGFVWEWLREHKHRAHATTKTREVAKLERELAVLRDAKGQVQDDVIMLLDKKKAG